MLVIFVRDVLYDLVCECSAESVGTGLLGMMVRICLPIDVNVQVYCSSGVHA